MGKKDKDHLLKFISENIVELRLQVYSGKLTLEQIDFKLGELFLDICTEVDKLG